MDCCTHVVHETGQRQRGRASPATDRRRTFEHEHRSPGLGQCDCRGQAVRPRTDDDRVVVGCCGGDADTPNLPPTSSLRDDRAMPSDPVDLHDSFPSGFFRRTDETPDDRFYIPDRLLTHIDDRAIAAAGSLYTELGLTGRVLDVMSSWISHFEHPPAELVVLGMNAFELSNNPMATASVVHDLNYDPVLPFADRRFDAVTCCVSVDYLTRPLDVFAEVRRVLVANGTFVCTFSNRCFPTSGSRDAWRGW